jgi:alpha-galactosidase
VDDLAARRVSASIEWREDDRQFHLHNGLISYLLRVLDDGSLGHLYLGSALSPGRSYGYLGPQDFGGFANRVGEPVAFEYPTRGHGDFRVPALALEDAHGATVVQPGYAGHTIRSGKPALEDLPSTYVESDDEAETVEIRLRDENGGLELEFRYTIFDGLPVVARSVRVRNGGTAPARLRTVMSASLDLPDAGWDLLQLSGTWARERHLVRRRLVPGRQGISSVRGASGHEHNPFLALVRPTTTEASGEAIGLGLVYSGNFVAEVEVEPFGTGRARIGIEPDTFSWLLEPGAAFQAPEAAIAWSGSGLGELSDAYHRLYRQRLARGTWRDRPRPILINNWEGTYFRFDETKLVEMATASRELGIELFVLDDGWFGERDDDTSSLGDWFVDRRKLPAGIDGLARRIESLGLQFGLWIEPEMVSERSQLFAAHPDWVVGVPGRPRTPSRQQLVLDLSRPEVVDHLFGVLSEVLGSAPIAYVKWDMNRNITEPYSPALPAERQGEFFHRYIRGVYQLYGRLTEAFPDILFESCAGGGGRFDPGILAFAPQGWTSDDTDAVERLRIQWGTSLAYPLSSMGAHVSAVPNHQVGRVTSLTTRATVAFFGVFGYELDPTVLTDLERREIAAQVAFYRRWRELFQRGRFVRLVSPFEGDGNVTAWMVVADDARSAIAGYYQVLSRPAPAPRRVPLRGLEPTVGYRITPWPSTGDRLEAANAAVRGGDELMRAGLAIDTDPRAADAPAPGELSETAARGDFWARLFVLEAVDG